jgi:hypothetical protein
VKLLNLLTQPICLNHINLNDDNSLRTHAKPGGDKIDNFQLQECPVLLNWEESYFQKIRDQNFNYKMDNFNNYGQFKFKNLEKIKQNISIFREDDIQFLFQGFIASNMNSILDSFSFNMEIIRPKNKTDTPDFILTQKKGSQIFLISIEIKTPWMCDDNFKNNLLDKHQTTTGQAGKKPFIKASGFCLDRPSRVKADNSSFELPITVPFHLLAASLILESIILNLENDYVMFPL